MTFNLNLWSRKSDSKAQTREIASSCLRPTTPDGKITAFPRKSVRSRIAPTTTAVISSRTPPIMGLSWVRSTSGAPAKTSFNDLSHLAGGIVPGDGIFTTWSYRAGAGRAEAFLLNPKPITVRTAYKWGVVAEIVPNGQAIARARELASLYLKAPEVTRRNTRAHLIQPLKERIVREVGYGLSLEGASAADLVKSMHAKAQPVVEKGKIA
jgi:hypothetical protein